jgi:hypothetical protein
LEQVTRELMVRLKDRPVSREFDADCESWLDRYLQAAAGAEAALLPRRLQRALQQMHTTCRAWGQQSRQGRDNHADRWEALARLAQPAPDAEVTVDPYQVAERWLQLIQPTREQHRRATRRNRYSRIADVDNLLRDQPLTIGAVEDRLPGSAATRAIRPTCLGLHPGRARRQWAGSRSNRPVTIVSVTHAGGSIQGVHFGVSVYRALAVARQRTRVPDTCGSPPRVLRRTRGLAV